MSRTLQHLTGVSDKAGVRKQVVEGRFQKWLRPWASIGGATVCVYHLDRLLIGGFMCLGGMGRAGVPISIKGCMASSLYGAPWKSVSSGIPSSLNPRNESSPAESR